MAAQIAAATAAGDVAALATLAIQLANENARLAGHAAALEEAERARKEKQNSRVRRHRNVTQRDVTLHDVTQRDVTGHGDLTPPPPAGKEKGFICPPPTPETNSVSRAAPRPRAARPPTPSWVADGVALWQEIVGDVKPGEFGASLKAMVDRHGWPAVRTDLEKWLRERAAVGKPCKPAWYAGEVTARLAPKPPIVDEHGQLTEYGERITRPAAVSA